MELVSIVIPVYNCETKLKRCLQSVQKQTYKDIEVLIVNDGSTDN
ncbi:MAG: glycosyltransferase, partial [Agathobacter rectalis]|nr:glycosyltransferase [Agathobacter rectalis]